MHSQRSQFQHIRILGIEFFNDTLETALEFTLETKGLILAPSGPGLASLGENAYYDQALKHADLNLIDSGYLALLWRQKTGDQLKRHSGLKFIKALIEHPDFRNNPKQLWVMPSDEHIQSAMKFLQSAGVSVSEQNFYRAPYYNQVAVKDSTLFRLIETQRPEVVILAIAGGKQEVLGHWLKQRVSEPTSIVCIGAAIAFLSGEQATIPTWADRIYIGWLLRILKDPKTFIPRYWNARKLKNLFHRYGEDAPEATL